QTEATPNPNALKFIPGVAISPEGPLFFNNFSEARAKSSLASKLYDIENVEAVFFGTDFITITKTEDGDWQLLKPEILMTIMDHLVAGLPVLDKQTDISVLHGRTETNQADLSDIEKQIIEIIETRVRPS